MDEFPTIRVMIVDDHAMVRRGLAIFLETVDDMVLVGEASSGLEAVRLCGELKPDVILMDVMMPEMDGLTATGIIRQKYPEVQVIILSNFQGDETKESILAAGAAYFLSKSTPIGDLAHAVRAAYAGK